MRSRKKNAKENTKKTKIECGAERNPSLPTIRETSKGLHSISIAYLVLETTREHFVGLVEDEDLHVLQREHTTIDHIIDTSGSADHDLHAVLQSANVVAHESTADARV